MYSPAGRAAVKGSWKVLFVPGERPSRWRGGVRGGGVTAGGGLGGSSLIVRIWVANGVDADDVGVLGSSTL